MKKALAFALLLGIVPVTALAAQTLEPVPDGVMIVTHTLNVTVLGIGTVTSNPEGINCVNGTGQCSHLFPIDTPVALLATAPPADESGSYFFYQWSGDATGTATAPTVVAAAAVVMDGDKNVTAQFVALGPPIAVTVLPDAQGATFYHPVFDPVKNPSLETCRPIAIAQDPDVTNLYLGLPIFDQAVDVYIAVAVPGLSDMIIFGPGSSIHLLSDGLVAWKQNLTSEADDTLLGMGISSSVLPAGTYQVYVMVTAAGNMSVSHVWETYFEIIHGQSMIPLALP